MIHQNRQYMDGIIHQEEYFLVLNHEELFFVNVNIPYLLQHQSIL